MNSMNRREFLKAGVAASSLFALGAGAKLAARSSGRRQTSVKLLILGFDGMDPRLTRLWMDEGKLPNFRRLAEQGAFSRLQTSLPPQSPVAWSNFIAGTDPGGHGIFDFMHRDPQTYIPIFSGTSSEEAKTTVKVGKWILPLRGGSIKNLRRGHAFWQVLEENDIPATVFKMPANYPPVETRQRTLSGMGTPDLAGSYGRFNYYTTKFTEINEDVGGGRVHEVYVIGNRVEAKLPGPINTFKLGRPDAEIDFKVFLDPVNPVAKIIIQDQEFILKEKEWSGWKKVRFSLIPTQSVSGICMFHLKEVRPHFRLYISPVNIDPKEAALPLSTPGNYAEELAEKFGPFFTKGLPADTSALDNDVLDEEEFLEQDDFVLQESLDMFDYELSRFDSGLLFYYISNTDQRQHMFWRFLDKQHPAHDESLSSKFGNVIENIYIEADKILGKAMAKAGKDTVVMAMSDHGFNPFRSGFNLNSWLLDSGYHRLTNPWRREQASLFDLTDWSRTKAYGIGLNGLYINRKGRERLGLVAAGAESENLVREIARKLEQITDPKTGEKVILKAFVSGDVYRGAHVADAPDIILGFNEGYRISWGSPLGRFPKEILEDNREKWSGDHMSAPEIMPGILCANRKIKPDFPALYDLTATIFSLFGVEKTGEMIGKPVF